MGLGHYIAEGFRAVVSTLDDGGPDGGEAVLPGGIYYGARAEADTPLYPLGLLHIEEVDREFNSGGGSLATYDVRLTVYAQAGQQYPAESVRRVAAYFAGNTFSLLGTMPAEFGRLVSMLPQTGTIEEDPDDEFGQDTNRASITWQITLSERVKL
ncbi:MAG: hypothetical protein V3U39_12370 [Acidimicrobiia bacterium]